MSLLVACGGDAARSPALDVLEPEPVGTPVEVSSCTAGAPAAWGGRSDQTTVPKVRVHFTSQKCGYTVEEAKAGIVFEYAVIVEPGAPSMFFQAGSGRAPFNAHEQLNATLAAPFGTVPGTSRYVGFSEGKRAGGDLATIKPGVIALLLR